MADINKKANIDVSVTGDKKARSRLGNLSNFIKKKLVISMGDLVRAMKFATSAMGDFINKGLEFKRLERSFKSLTKSYGVDSRQLLSELQKAGDGTVEMTKLMEGANKALLLTSGVVADKIPRLLEIARASAKATGQDVDFLFNSVITGIGRGSPLILDNLGLTIKLSEVYGDYATTLGKTAEELSKTEQQQALLNNILEKGEDLIEKTGVASRDSLDAFQQWNVEMKDLETNMSTRVAPALAVMGSKLLKFTNSLFKSNEQVKESGDVQKKYSEITKAEATKRADAIATEINLIDSKQKKATKEYYERLQASYTHYVEIETLKTEEEERAATRRKIIKEREAEEEATRKALAAEAKKKADKKAAEEAEKLAKEEKDAKVQFALEAADAMGKASEDGGAAALGFLKRSLNAQIDAWIATEIGKMASAAPGTFGASLLAIPAIIGAGSAAKAAIGSVKFAQGGQFEAVPQNFTTTTGQSAMSNEKGVEVHDVKPIGKSQASGGGSVAPIIIMLGNKELKRMAIDLKPYLNAVDRGVI